MYFRANLKSTKTSYIQIKCITNENDNFLEKISSFKKHLQDTLITKMLCISFFRNRNMKILQYKKIAQCLKKS